MRRKNGTTIVELLISVVLIAIILALLFNLLVQVRNEDITNNTQSDYVINQAAMIKEIEQDMIDYGVKKISSCSLSEANINNNNLNAGTESKFKCIKIEYAADYTEDNIGFIMVYDTYAKYDVDNGEYVGIEDTATWMIQYVRGHYESKYGTGSTRLSSWTNATKYMKEYPDEVGLSDIAYLRYTASAGTDINAASLVLPIINDDGVHYDINLSFTFTGNDNFKCTSSNENMFKCECLSTSTLCSATY